jgi:nitrite reductase/ring-hydroxylating ferredoxin subunit
MDRERSTEAHFVRAFSLSELPEMGCRTVTLEGHVIAVFQTIVGIFAVDNRCPHMGFPLDRGSVKDCILTCHWHHARFDLKSGGTFDQWADDVRVFPVEVRDGAVWIDVAEQDDLSRRRIERLRVGLERDIPLVIGKSVIGLMQTDGGARDAFKLGLEFGTHNRRSGWGSGLTILPPTIVRVRSIRGLARWPRIPPGRLRSSPCVHCLAHAQISRRSSDGSVHSSKYATAKAPNDVA